MSIEYLSSQNSDGQRTLTIVAPDGVIVLDGEHPNYDTIVYALSTDVDIEIVKALADIPAAIATKFERLSERVSVANGQVYFDGDVLDNAITGHLLRCLDAEVEDWQPLVAFMENVAANPSEHSREQLYSWLAARDFTITHTGTIVAYKGAQRDEDGTIVSINSGPDNVVNGEMVDGYVPNEVGNVIEMARSRIDDNPNAGCSVGLHVGSYEYANGFARGVVVKVEVNPRDVVSVPNDHSFAKVRTCRYIVTAVTDVPVESPIAERSSGLDELDDEAYWNYLDAEYSECQECGEEIDAGDDLCYDCDEELI